MPVWKPVVSAKQPLSPIEARSNYKLVGQSFGSFVVALETLAQSTGKHHPPSVWLPRTNSLSTPACCPLRHQLAKSAQQPWFPSRRPWLWERLATMLCRDDDSGHVLFNRSDFCESELKVPDPRFMFLIHPTLLCTSVLLTAVCLPPFNSNKYVCMFGHKILEGLLSDSPVTQAGLVFRVACYSVRTPSSVSRLVPTARTTHCSTLEVCNDVTSPHFTTVPPLCSSLDQPDGPDGRSEPQLTGS